MFRYMLILCLIMDTSNGHQHLAGDETSCYSRFDYEYKVVQKLVQFEERQDKMSQTIEAQREQITASEQRQDQMSQTIQAQREQITAFEEQIAASDERHDKLQQTAQTQREQITGLTTDADEASKTMKTLKRENSKVGRYCQGGGSTYVRWGRTSCPGNGTELVYPGYAGGSWFDHKGAAVSYLCLPQDPLWGKYDDTVHDRAMIYGAEYEAISSVYTGRTSFNDDVPCAVCRSPRPSVLMIPARNECYGNWTLEYHGYLMAGYHGHPAASDYVCLDEDPESIEGGKADTNGKLFYEVEGKCGSLKCPPYVSGRELTCVVCSK